MDSIRIEGGHKLNGEIMVSGAKNSGLKIMAASLLTEGVLEVSNMPDLKDIISMADLLSKHGVKISIEGTSDGDGSNSRVMKLCGAGVNDFVAPYDLVRKMRTSILVLGPLLARFGQAQVSMPGGCAIGVRPIDMHLEALRALGAEITVTEGYISASVNGRLKGAHISFRKPSVGATENAMMAATLAEGTTILENVAQEPEIVDLADCLNSMGAEITGAGTHTITIKGKERLHGAKHKLVGDRIEAGTYAVAGALCGGKLKIRGISPKLLTSSLALLREVGIKVEEGDDDFTVYGYNNEILPAKSKSIKLITAPYPGFPTDLQAQFMTLLCFLADEAFIEENIFENRFMHVPELNRLGADIEVFEHTAHIKKVEKMTGAEVMASDLRASACLVLAGLRATGTTVVNRIYHLDRGYEHLEQKLKNCGAVIERFIPSSINDDGNKQVF